MFRYIEEWLGCLRPIDFICLWQSCQFIVVNAPVTYIDYYVIYDSIAPDAQPYEEKWLEAFTVIFGLTFGYIEIDEVPIPVFFMNNPVQWYASAPYVLSFPEDVRFAPCTQQIFP